MMNHRKLVGTIAASLMLVLHARAEKPNIVFMMSDDMGYETTGFNGAVNYRTPTLDSLAAQSVVFTQCDAMPLCCPTRTRVITGQYNYRNYTGWNGRFQKTAPTLAELLKSAGYATGAFGKWHLGGNGSETRLGFEDTCLFRPSGNQAELMKHAYWQARYVHNGKIEIGEYGPDLANRYALEFIEKNKNKPFFLYYTPWLSHNPNQPTPDSKDRNCKDWQRNFEDMVAYTDKLIGKVIQKLKDLGIYDNTIILYTSDNGTKTCMHVMRDGSVIYGGKGTHTVDGCHVPLIVKDGTGHKTLDALIDMADFYPTFADWAGVPREQMDPTIDGFSFSPVLRGENRPARSVIFSWFDSSVYVRDRHFKYYIDQRVYDIQADPRETRPFYPENDTPATAGARERLQRELDRILNDERLAVAVHKQRVAGLRRVGSGKRSQWMLGCWVFDRIGKDPKPVTFTADITPFVSQGTSDYNVRFSRSYLSGNSGLIYSDARIRALKVTCDGKTLRTVEPEEARLATRPKAKVVNPIVDFNYNETTARISLDHLSIPEGGKRVCLTVDAELSNPGNQWGDRIRLFAFLGRKKE